MSARGCSLHSVATVAPATDARETRSEYAVLHYCFFTTAFSMRFCVAYVVKQDSTTVLLEFDFDLVSRRR